MKLAAPAVSPNTVSKAGSDGAADATANHAAQFAECRPHLLKQCRKILGNSDLAEDAVHETYLRALRNLGQFDGVNLRAWLTRIARNVCIDQIRADLARLSLEEEAEPVAVGYEMRKVTALQIRRILGALPENQRLCLKLFYIEGFSAKEVSTATGFNENQVKSYLQNGRRNFIKRWKAANKRP